VSPISEMAPFFVPLADIIWILLLSFVSSSPNVQRVRELYDGLQRYRAFDRTCDIMLLFLDEVYDMEDFDFIVRCRALLLDVLTPPDGQTMESVVVPAGMFLLTHLHLPMLRRLFDAHIRCLCSCLHRCLSVVSCWLFVCLERWLAFANSFLDAHRALQFVDSIRLVSTVAAPGTRYDAVCCTVNACEISCWTALLTSPTQLHAS